MSRERIPRMSSGDFGGVATGINKNHFQLIAECVRKNNRPIMNG